MRTRRESKSARITQNGWIDPFTKNLRERLDPFGVPSSSVYYPLEYRSFPVHYPFSKTEWPLNGTETGSFFDAYCIYMFL